MGFRGGGRKLVPLAKGTGGLSQLLPLLDEKQVMFAAIRVVGADAQTRRDRFVAVTWVGKSVSPLKRMKVLMHKGSMSRLFSVSE